MAKKNKVKDLFLEELKKVPIIAVACEKTNLSRQSVYRWRTEDKTFAKAMDNALAEGELFINDMSEHQLFSLIKEKSFPAVRFWLNKRHPKFRDKVEVTTIKDVDEELTPDQQKIVNKAYRLAYDTPKVSVNQYVKPTKQHDTKRSVQSNDERSKSKKRSNKK